MGLPVAVRSWSVAAQSKNARGDDRQAHPRCTSSLSPAALWRGFFLWSGAVKSPLMQRGLLITFADYRTLCGGPSDPIPPP